MIIITIKIETADDLFKHLDELPGAVVADIDKRITDWLASGGSDNDPYIKQQFRYAERVLNRKDS